MNALRVRALVRAETRGRRFSWWPVSYPQWVIVHLGAPPAKVLPGEGSRDPAVRAFVRACSREGFR